MQRLKGTNEGQDNGEAMALVGVRLTIQLGRRVQGEPLVKVIETVPSA